MRRLSLVREHCVALRLAACAASTGTNPPGFGSASAAAAGLSPNAPPATDGIAGRFKGTVIDSALGSAKAELHLSQTSAGNAGGAMKFKFRVSGEKVSSYVALDATTAKNITGTAIAIIGGESSCTLTITAKYDPTTYTLIARTSSLTTVCRGRKERSPRRSTCYYVVGKQGAIENVRPSTSPRVCS